MSTTKNPWVSAGTVAGIAVAAGLWLVWPSPASESHAAAVTRVAAPSAAPADVCRKCLEQRCDVALRACYGSWDGKPVTWPPEDAGGPPTAEERAGCQEVYECFRRTGCGAQDPGICYCGANVDVEKCFAGQEPASGPCKTVIEKNAGTTDPRAIGLRYSDERYPLALGEDLRLCSVTFCRDACK